MEEEEEEEEEEVAISYQPVVQQHNLTIRSYVPIELCNWPVSPHLILQPLQRNLEIEFMHN